MSPKPGTSIGLFLSPTWDVTSPYIVQATGDPQ